MLKMTGKIRLILLMIIYANIENIRCCEFKIIDAQEKKDEVLQLLDDGRRFIYLDLNLDGFVDQFDNKMDNSLYRWIWTKKETSFLLTYPEEFPAMTFNFLDKALVQHLSLGLNLTDVDCEFSYEHDSRAIRNLLFQDLFRNQSDWLLCHRWFENQEWKPTFNTIFSYWLGYDFECFKSHCEKSYFGCKQNVSKSAMNYFLLAFICLVCLYFPLVFLLFPDRLSQREAKVCIDNYFENDKPYSISRLFLFISNHKEYNMYNDDSITSKLLKSVYSIEFRLMALVFVIIVAFQMVRIGLVNYFIPDYSLYPSIYGNFGEMRWFGVTLVDGVAGIFIDLTIFSGIIFVLSAMLSLYIDLFLVSNNHFFIPVFWCKGFFYINIDDVFEKPHIGPKYIGYTAFARKFLKRIEALFTMKFYLSLGYPVLVKCTGNTCCVVFKKIVIGFAVVLSGLFNIIFCLIPVWYFYLTPIRLLLFSVGSGNRVKRLYYILVNIIFVLMSILFLSGAVIRVCVFLLQVIIFNVFIVIPIYDISFKFWTIFLATCLYLFTFYQNFVDTYRNLLQRSLDYTDTNHSGQKYILVKNFEFVVEKTYPLRIQIALFIGKVLLLALFSYPIIVLTMSQDVGKDTFIANQFPLIVLYVLPVVIMRFYRKKNKQLSQKYCNMLKEIVQSGDIDGSENLEKLKDIKFDFLNILHKFMDTKLGSFFITLFGAPAIIFCLLKFAICTALPCLGHPCNSSCRCVVTKNNIYISSDPDKEPLLQQIEREDESLTFTKGIYDQEEEQRSLINPQNQQINRPYESV